ncbi:MAG TPA: hypothetical protein VFW64_12405 [Pseudonocardiaceae bacterium]|nr:hypothetical protein [Pseudonocardiaceae bacterium]
MTGQTIVTVTDAAGRTVEYSLEAYERGRAYAREHPAPEHIVAEVNRALRGARRDEATS